MQRAKTKINAITATTATTATTAHHPRLLIYSIADLSNKLT